MAQATNVKPSTTSSFDSADYNPIEHLNAIFSQPSSLSSVHSVSAAVRKQQDALDTSIRLRASRQRESDNESVLRIQHAQSELAGLFSKIEGVRTRALETERAITDMTADIKRLDRTKKNLTQSMTALKRLQMLTTAYEQLRALSRVRQYAECAQLLQAVIQLMAHFRTYRSIDQIASLSKAVVDLQRELLEQVCEDFEMAFAKGEVQSNKATLAEACHVMDALGDHARARLVTWYCNTQLREYRQVFRGNDEAGSLDNIGRRYSWFNRMLKTYDAEHAALFPPHWRVNEMLANAFCEGTREDYKGILQRSMRRADGQAPDVDLLLSCLQDTLDFEHSLERRFAVGESRSSIDTVNSGREGQPHGFSQAISEAFEPYLSIWVESQDRQLASLIPKYRQQPVRNPDEDYHPHMVISSSTELFHSYRVTLAQCAKLSTGGRLLELSRTFAKHLDAYSQQVLFHFLSERSGAQGPSVEDVIVILNTADYCYQTTGQLEERIKARIDEDLREQVDLQSQADSFMGIASASVRVLVRKVELDCDAAWREMRSVPWSKMDSVGDQSAYVTSLTQRVRDRATEILKQMPTKKQYAGAFCDHLVDSLITSFIANLVVSRPITETAAEQMLLDSYALKKALVDIPVLTAEKGTPAPPAFTKRVASSMGKLDAILKTLQVRSSPSEGLVQAYLIHIRDKSEQNFRKMLEIKGIGRRQDQAHLVELFNAHKDSPSNHGLAVSNPSIASLSLTATSLSSTAHHAAQGSTGLGLAGLKDAAVGGGTGIGIGIGGSNPSPALSAAGRFDPSAFGSAIMNAARDGVDRFGTPTLGGSATNASAAGGLQPGGSVLPSAAVSRGSSPPPSGVGTTAAIGANGGTEKSLNENLKNIGKFFRRDGASFGGFGRKDEGRQSLDKR